MQVERYFLIAILIITCFGAGFGINRQDIYITTVKAIKKINLWLAVAAGAALLFAGYTGNQLLNYAPFILLAFVLLLNVWPARNPLIKKSTISSYAAFIFCVCFVAFGIMYSLVNVAVTLPISKVVINIILFLAETIVLANVFIWVINKFLSSMPALTAVGLLVAATVMYITSSNLFFLSNASAVIILGYLARNTIFSIANRKNISAYFNNPYLHLVLFAGVFFLNIGYLHYTLSNALIAVGASVVLFVVAYFAKSVFYINKFSIPFLLILFILFISQPYVLQIAPGNGGNASLAIIMAFCFLALQIITNIAFAADKSIYVSGKIQQGNKLTPVTAESGLYSSFKNNALTSQLQDFSYAGFKYGEGRIEDITVGLKQYNVTDFGITPGDGTDVTAKMQECIDAVGKQGGGIIFFPAGTYNLNMQKNMVYLHINYSNIILKGERDETGNKTFFVTYNPTMIGTRNPWLSPFLITYGTNLQKTNLFWGLQFKNKKEIKTRSNSLTDPGSDGTIQSPEFYCKITADSLKGQRRIVLEDASQLKENRFLLIGMYNTTDDGNLIKELLNRDTFLPEWKTAFRAGPERAPSYQWLVEIESIEDGNTVVLKQPLRRDILTKFEPVAYPVPMIENAGIEDITFKTKWHGIFRHHGAPVYFTTTESQVMDYGWNAINFCRVAHGFMRNVNIENFTNPLYVQDSRNITVENVFVSGHDGHQGIKLYGHSADNLFRNMTFSNHYADMIGGEGNCYGNVFSGIKYVNAENKAVDFDFHGFSEGPFSPPSYTLFENCDGFRGIKASGTIFNQPACALGNTWWNISSEGYEGSTELFKHDQYKHKPFLRVFVSAFYRATIYCLQRNKFSVKFFAEGFKQKKADIIQAGLAREKHYTLFKNSIIVGYKNPLYNLTIAKDSKSEGDGLMTLENFNNQQVAPYSLYNQQLSARLKK